MSSGILATGTIGSQFYSKTSSLNLPAEVTAADSITGTISTTSATDAWSSIAVR